MENQSNITTAIAWCLTWGDQRQPQCELDTLQQMRQALNSNQPVPKDVQSWVEQAQQLARLTFPETRTALMQLTHDHPLLWESKIGLVYGGATKIKQYVFEAAKLPDIRGASVLLDRINLVDLPAFFARDQAPESIQQWLEENGFAELANALVPELIIYSTGGNILAFCPAAYIQDLTDAIEKRYATETLTANSCAVGEVFRLLELEFGQLQESIETTFWLDQYLVNQTHPLISAYFEQSGIADPLEKFQARKNFSELVGKLAEHFTQRRNGNLVAGEGRSSRCYPPIFETHPYVQRDSGDCRSAIFHAKSNPNDSSEGLPGDPLLSESLARKRLVGQIAKREYTKSNLPKWWKALEKENGLDWQPGEVDSWVKQFENALSRDATLQRQYNPDNVILKPTKSEARSLREIADASSPKGFVAYIYADGNNMGGYIRSHIKTPEAYQSFSQDIFDATQQSVYVALARHLHPHFYKPDAQSSRYDQEQTYIHPFEIITIGGDDVLLVVPADQALAIAKTIGEEFERLLPKSYRLNEFARQPQAHRYCPEAAPPSMCRLSMSMGVLITAENTPIYYADKLVSQLLKSAKKHGKSLKKYGYTSGTIDFLVLKAVTMISSNISEFRAQALTKERKGQPTLKLYSAPYTLHEIGGLLTSAHILKKAKFPRSQLYQLRGLLERGKRTAMLNYRYFRVRLSQGQAELKQEFEEAWCKPQDATNEGNLAPWRLAEARKENASSTYETIWRELVDLYPFIPEPDSDQNSELLDSLASEETK